MFQKLKPAIVVFPLVIAAALMFALTQQGSAESTEDIQTNPTDSVHNPGPQKCCACFEPELEMVYTGTTQNIDPRSDSEKSASESCMAMPYANGGKYKITVNVKKKSGVTGCDSAMPKVSIYKGKDKDTPMGAPVSGPSIGWSTQHELSGAEGDVFIVKVECEGASHSDSYNCPKACIKIGCGGCGDDSCNTGVCGNTATPGTPNVSDTMGTSNHGDSAGLGFTYGADQIANVGVAGLRFRGPNDGSVTVTRDAQGNLASVRTGNLVATIATVGTAEDPMAFTITKSTNLASPNQDVFRVTKFENKTIDGQLVFHVSSTYKGEVTSLYYAQPVTGTWDLVTGVSGDSPQGLRKQRTVINEVGDVRTERLTTSDIPTGDTIGDVETTYTTFPWGVRRTRQVDFSGADDLVSTWDYYEPGEVSGLNGGTHGYGRLQTYSRYDGYEETHLYDLNTHTIFKPFAGTDGGLVETHEYHPQSKTQTISKNVGGVLISKTETVDESETLTRTRRYTRPDEFLETVIERYPYGQDFGGQMKKISRPDGTVTIYEYVRDTDSKTTTTWEGVAEGDSISEGTKTQRIVNLSGELVSSITWAVGGSGAGLVLNHQVTETYDLHRPTRIGYFPQDGGGYAYSTSRHYGCCGLVNETDRYGITTHYAYDALRRVIKTNRLGVTTETQYKGLTTHTLRFPEVGSVAEVGNPSTSLQHEVSRTVRTMTGLTTTWTADADSDGDMEKTTRQVRYQVAPENIPANLMPDTPEYDAYMNRTTGASVVTTTYPDNSGSITRTWLDGRTRSTTSQGGGTTSYTYAAHSEHGGGIKTRTTLSGGSQWTDTYTDLAGRRLKTEYADGALASHTYYGKSATPAAAIGKLASSTDPDGITVNYTYNNKGERIVAQAIAGSQTRTSTSESSIVSDPDLGTAHQSVTIVNGKTVSTSLRSIDGMSSKSITLGGTSTSQQVLTGSGAWTVTSTTPDGQKSVQTYTGGRLQRSESFDNSPTPVSIAFTTYHYDALGRAYKSTDSRTGDTEVTSYTDTDAPLSVTTNGGNDTTSYAYDSMGRRIAVTLPDSSVTSTSYTDGGQVLATWGSQTYARLYQYDLQGRMVELRTYQNLPDGTEPTVATADYASTEWVYDPLRGWLSEKNYDGESSPGDGAAQQGGAQANSTADYTYTAAGRLKTRTWERGVTTTYTYDAGMLAKTDYSDSTPDVEQVYDHFGRQKIVTQIKTIVKKDDTGMPTIGEYPISKHVYAYDDATMALDTETVSYDTDDDGILNFTRVIDRKQDTFLRPIGYELKNGTGTESSVTYGFDSANRLSQITNHQSQIFTYGYVVNSYGLVHTVTGPAHTVTNTYEPKRNVLTNKENAVPSVSSVVSNFAYNVNKLGQRTNLTTSGTAFGTAPDYTWTYNARGELVEAMDASQADNNRAYLYDGIGNRKATTHGLRIDLPEDSNYIANALNQYTSIGSVLPAYDLDGNATAYPLPADTSANATLVWDAENRLTAVTRPDAEIITFSYDYLSRRISKQVNAQTKTLYLYDGWNPIADYTSQNSQPNIQNSYTWGMDLSGSMQGAGGVGGLLAVHQGASTYYPTHDGNGNVSEYLDSTGTVQAHYEYDAFGNTLETSGVKANDFAHRFSTKPLDTETGLYYYGYRYYDPVTGRWPSRDPLGERGGLNVYGFVNNDGINITDRLGLEERVSAEYKGEAYFTAYYKLYQRQPFKQKLIATGHINSDHLATLRGKLSGTYIVDDLGQGIIKKGGRRFQEVFINALGTGTVNSEVWAGIFDSQHAGVGYSISKGDIYAINSRCDMCVTGTITYLVKLTERSMALTPGGGGSFSEKGVSYSVGLSLSLSEGGSLLAQRTNEVSFKICTDGTSEVTENHGQYETYNDFSSTTLARIRASSAVLDRHMDDLNGFGATEIKLGGFEITFQ
ncbi:RHS repeat-associated core domain-containing protein [Verrucomicrobiaceae bacterium N1E253]|uniref:RHS repeat-associated core domain-containing protein n=1 Tax=Oceaniferula marina TaxID=2748318 RepID=A0A851GIZ4_9BACT|nr:RHS repeat-associated core domain-containing protein [Oceaniferula marina]NWK55087.1 RHS repeat-associated core domain-containing protein [Oceaniferula marina]